MSGGNNRALRKLIVCYDTYGSDFKKAVAATLDKLKTPFRQTVNDAEQCPRWQEHSASYQFVQSDIPTLILSAEFDDRTPTEHAKRIAAGFKKVKEFTAKRTR
jgi:hypothetical protein